MKLFASVTLLSIAVLLCSGCGQKGPLREPNAPEQYKHIKF